MIDAHIHLDQYAGETLAREVESWQRAGITGVIAVSTHLASAYVTLELKMRYPDFVHAAVGYHPEQPLPCRRELDELFSLLKQERRHIAAIGEVGLPHYRLREWGDPPLEPYRELLTEFAWFARHLDLPILLHAVHDKAEAALDILLQVGVERAHFHWLKAPEQVVGAITAAGYYISLTPDVCIRARDQDLARKIPLPLLLLETDGPWSYDGPFTGQKTTPLLLWDAAREVARIHGTGVEQLARQCQENALRLLGLHTVQTPTG